GPLSALAAYPGLLDDDVGGADRGRAARPRDVGRPSGRPERAAPDDGREGPGLCRG
ncbi:MAG: hypothetical protein AVDCRST_MAG15-2545, partial [uncultured Rubellimicrobium sp.]